MPGAVRAKGNLKIQLNTGTTAAPVWVDVPGVRTVSGGGVNTDRIDVTAFDSPGNSKEYIGGLADPQAFSFDISYIPGNTTQQALRTANADGSTHSFRLLLGAATANEEAATFDALVTKYSAPVGDPTKELTVSVELTPASIPTYAAATGT